MFYISRIFIPNPPTTFTTKKCGWTDSRILPTTLPAAQLTARKSMHNGLKHVALFKTIDIWPIKQNFIFIQSRANPHFFRGQLSHLTKYLSITFEIPLGFCQFVITLYAHSKIYSASYSFPNNRHFMI